MSKFAKGNAKNKPTAISDTERRQIDIDREEVRRGGLRAFTRMAWPLVEPATVYKGGWHIDAIADHLQAVYRGQMRHLLITVPPGCMKSLETCVFGPAFAWIEQPGLAWIFASFDAGLTLRDSGKTLRLLQSEWFRKRWGHRVTVADDVAGGEYETAQGGFRFATSVNGKTTGRHPDIVVIDDPLKPKDATKTNLENCQNWWRNTMLSRARDPATVRRICIMQRIHQDDLAGMFIKAGNWEHLNLPMRFEESRACVTTLPWRDPRTKEGELLWPEHFPEQEVLAREHPETGMGAMVAAAQLQQRPAPAGGFIFKREWFQEFNRKVPIIFDSVCQSWDCTFKKTDASDFVVGQVWGRKGSKFYLLDEVRGRMSFPETCEAIRALKRKWPRVHAILVEDKANGPAVESVLVKDIPGIIMVNPMGGKESRANSAALFFEAKNVFHPDPKGYWPDPRRPEDRELGIPDTWVDAHREELVSFPTGSNDDRVDSCSQALIWLAEKRSALSAAMKSLGKSPNPFG